MRILQLVMSTGGAPGPRDPNHAANVRKAIEDDIASGKLIATGGIGKRATAAARITSKGGVFTVEDPPEGDSWMAAGGYALIDVASKEEAIAQAKAKLEIMGDGIVELIQVSEMHPQPRTPSGDVRTGRDGVAAGNIALIDHIGVGVSNVAHSAAFYDAALGALGLHRALPLPVNSGADAVGYGVDYPVFWIDRFHPHGVRQHTAFAAKSRAAVDAFHAAAVKAGGIDNGPPGLRDTAEGYLPGYYSAFVLDPDGNNIEAVFRDA